jgi:hypothetical protein
VYRSGRRYLHPPALRLSGGALFLERGTPCLLESIRIPLGATGISMPEDPRALTKSVLLASLNTDASLAFAFVKTDLRRDHALGDIRHHDGIGAIFGGGLSISHFKHSSPSLPKHIGFSLLLHIIVP